MDWLPPLVVFLLGLAVGSFINVCAYRLPRGKSVVRPRSACPACSVPIRWYDNIPILSFVLLKGRCRNCGAGISRRYPAVELLTGVLFAWVYFYVAAFSLRPFLIPFFWYFCASLVALSAIDIEHYIIPDRITYPLAAAGLALAAIYPARLGGGSLLDGLRLSATGLVVGGGSLYLIRVLGRVLFKKEAMGMGDVKLLAAVGAWQGWPPALLAIFLAAAAASVVGVAMIAAKKARWQSKLPFGPYLALGALATLFYGPALLNWYLGLYR